VSTDPSAELVSPLAVSDDEVVDAALRPKRLGDFIGQHRVREQLSVVLDAAKARGRPPDHVLLSGSPGLGKTTLAMIIAAELGAPMRITSGPAIERAGDLAALLSTLSEGEVLFLDEIHRMARPAEEMLYVAMEDFRVDVVVGKGPGATAIPLAVAPFTLVGATTRAGLLPGPLRDRFGFVAHLDFYSADELEAVLHRSADLLAVELTADGAAEIAGRARGTPRIANRLLRRVRDFAEVRANGTVDREVSRAALEMYDVDELGLDRLDKAVLDALLVRFGGGPVGLSTLAVAVSEEPETVETVAEPFLVRAGLLARTPRGRVATPAAWRHVGLRPPRTSGSADVQAALIDLTEDEAFDEPVDPADT
jgi:Holliday junction DNA helicase RuvB